MSLAQPSSRSRVADRSADRRQTPALRVTGWLLGAAAAACMIAWWIGWPTVGAADPTPALSAPAPAPAEPAASAAAPESPSAEPAQPTFDGRPIRPARTIRMRVTAYSPDARSCGKFADGITASGLPVTANDMKLVAADTRDLPFGTILTIPGYHDAQPVPVLDRGGKIKGNRLDVLYPTHERALQWGVQWLDVTIWEYADEQDVSRR